MPHGRERAEEEKGAGREKHREQRNSPASADVVHEADHGRRGRGDGIAEPLHRRRESGGVLVGARQPHHEDEDGGETSALSHATEPTPDRPYLWGQQQAEGDRAPEDPHHEDAAERPQPLHQDRRTERSYNCGQLEH